jgi:hypothetical protein
LTNSAKKKSNKSINKKMASSSSLLCQFFLISATAIGTLLMILPDANALECYVSRTKNASALSADGCATWELNKMLTIATGNDENPLAVSIGNGTPTMDCGDFPFCVTLHCARAFGMLFLLCDS